MRIQKRLQLLTTLYDIHEAYAADARTACAKGCSACCTCNVTVTTMEGLLIYEYFMAEGRAEDLAKGIAAISPQRYQPRTTLNHMAALCARGKEPPDETNDPAAGTCPLLRNDECSIYPVRPLGCRAMLSSADCRSGGEAQMPPFMLTVNNVMMQYVEAVDQPGHFGNLWDVLNSLAADAARESYTSGIPVDVPAGLLVNRSFPVLMVPPEHQQSIRPLIQSLGAAVQRHQNHQ